MDDETASMDAEGIEHHVSSETLERFNMWTQLLAAKGLVCDGLAIKSFELQALNKCDRRRKQPA